MQMSMHVKASIQLRDDNRNVRQEFAFPFHATIQLVEIKQIILCRTMIMVAEHQSFFAIQSCSNSEILSPKAEIAKMPNDITFPNDAIPALHKLFVVLLNGCKWAIGLYGLEYDDVLMAEMRVPNEERIGHLSPFPQLLRQSHQLFSFPLR